MTHEEMKVIMSVYRLWLTEKKEELVADFWDFADVQPKRKGVEKKRRAGKGAIALTCDFAFQPSA